MTTAGGPVAPARLCPAGLSALSLERETGGWCPITGFGGIHLTEATVSGGRGSPSRRHALPAVRGRVPGLVPHRCRLPGLPGVAALAGRVRLPVCAHAGGWRLADGRFKCAGCGGRTSTTAGTIFDRTRTPLTVWFTACWLFASGKDGISALSLKRTLEIGSYQTAWAMLHRLRSVLVRPGPGSAVGDGGGGRDLHRRRGAGPARWPGQGQEGAHRDRGRGAVSPRGSAAAACCPRRRVSRLAARLRDGPRRAGHDG